MDRSWTVSGPMVVSKRAGVTSTGTVVSTVDEFHLKADLVVIGYTMWLKFEGGPANRVKERSCQMLR